MSDLITLQTRNKVECAQLALIASTYDYMRRIGDEG